MVKLRKKPDLAYTIDLFLDEMFHYDSTSIPEVDCMILKNSLTVRIWAHLLTVARDKGCQRDVNEGWFICTTPELEEVLDVNYQRMRRLLRSLKKIGWLESSVDKRAEGSRRWFRLRPDVREKQIKEMLPNPSHLRQKRVERGKSMRNQIALKGLVTEKRSANTIQSIDNKPPITRRSVALSKILFNKKKINDIRDNHKAIGGSDSSNLGLTKKKQGSPDVRHAQLLFNTIKQAKRVDNPHWNVDVQQKYLEQLIKEYPIFPKVFEWYCSKYSHNMCRVCHLPRVTSPKQFRDRWNWIYEQYIAQQAPFDPSFVFNAEKDFRLDLALDRLNMLYWGEAGKVLPFYLEQTYFDYKKSFKGIGLYYQSLEETHPHRIIIDEIGLSLHPSEDVAHDYWEQQQTIIAGDGANFDESKLTPAALHRRKFVPPGETLIQIVKEVCREHNQNANWYLERICSDEDVNAKRKTSTCSTNGYDSRQRSTR